MRTTRYKNSTARGKQRRERYRSDTRLPGLGCARAEVQDSIVDEIFTRSRLEYISLERNCRRAARGVTLVLPGAGAKRGLLSHAGITKSSGRGCVSHALCKFPWGFALRRTIERANPLVDASRRQSTPVDANRRRQRASSCIIARDNGHFGREFPRGFVLRATASRLPQPARACRCEFLNSR